MDFPFGRRSSRDAGGEEDITTSLRSSITEGSSKLFGSVMAKKTGLLDGLSSKFDQVTNVLGDQEGQKTKTTVESGETRDTFGESSAETHSRPKSRVPPPKPPAPSAHSRLNGQLSRQYSADPGSLSRGSQSPSLGRSAGSLGKQGRQVSLPAHATVPDTSSFLGRSGVLDGIPSLANRSSKPATPPPPSKPTRTGTSYSPPTQKPYSAVSDIVAEIRPEQLDSKTTTTYDNSGTTEEVSVITDSTNSSGYSDRFSSKPGGYNSPYTTGTVQQPSYTPVSYNTDARSKDSTQIKSAIPSLNSKITGSDLLPGIPCAPSNHGTYNASPPASTKAAVDDSASFLAPRANDRDLLVITPTSGAALPMPAIEPVIKTKKNMDGYNSDDSSATEGCDEIASEPEEDLDYNGEIEGGAAGGDVASSAVSYRSNFNSDWLDDISKECLEFMNGFVEKIFTAQ